MKSYRKISSSLLCAVLFTPAAVWPTRADYPSVVQSFSPLAYWQFKEAGPSPAPFALANSGSLGNVADAHAIPSVASGVAGKVNNALRFTNPDGTGSCYSRADVMYNPALNTPVFSVEFWAQPSAQGMSSAFDSTGSCPISNFNPNNYAAGRVGWLFYLSPTTGKWNFRLGLASGYAANVVASSGLASAGTWQYVAATYDSTTVNLYVNGSLVGTATSPASSTGWVPNTGSVLRFGGTPLFGSQAWVWWTDSSHSFYYPLPWNTYPGGSPTSGNRGWDGLLDEVAMYTNVLSGSTIAAHYNAAATPATYGATIKADAPAGYWNFDEPAFTAPSASALPVSTNSGSLLFAADATNEWGAVLAQPGPGYAGFPAADKAVKIDGRYGYIAVKDAPGLHFNGNITMAAWIKPTAEDSIRDIISHGMDDNGAETFLRITRGDDVGTGTYYEVGVCDSFITGEYYDSVQVPIPVGDIGNWVFLAGTFDGANWNLYRNGVLVGSTPAYSSPTDQDTGAFDVTNAWTIGSRALPSAEDGYNFSGSIAEPAIFNKALAPGDIMALYNAAQVAPVITRAVQVPAGAYKGASATFTVWAEGSPTLGYSWTSNGVPVGLNATNLTLSSLATGNLTVAVTVTNAYGSNTSSVAFAVAASKPLITQQPAPVTRFVGLPFQFSVGAGGTLPISYQWNTNGTPIPGATSSTYTGIVSSATAGSYSVILTNEAGSSNSISVALTAVPVPSGYPGAVFASTPIAYWRLDETNGSSVAHDLMAGIDGVYHNTTLGVPGYSLLDPDTAASFNGGTNSYVGNISPTAINFPGHSVFTLEAWVKASAGQPDQATIIAKGVGNNGTTRTEQFALDVAGGVYRFFTINPNNTIYEIDAASGPNGSWQHLAAVYDDQNVLGGGSNMYLYVNGVLEASSKTRTGGVLANTANPVSIGSKRDGTDPDYTDSFGGTIDEVAIYNKPLDGATIQAHFAAAYGSTTAPFISVQPSSVTNYAGLPVTMSVVAAGTQPLTYQWKRNGTDLSGATDQAYNIDAVATTDAGTYTVGISNMSPTLRGLLSAPAVLVVLPAPTNPPAIPGLVLHLKFDGNLNDDTGRGNNGVSIHATTNATGGGYSSNVVAATYVPDGRLGQAFHYSTEAVPVGTTTVGTNDFYATLGVRPDLQFDTTVPFSVAYWIRLPLGFQGGDLPFFTDAVGAMGNNGYVFAPAYAYGTADPNPTTDPTAWVGCWGFTVYGPGGAAGIRIYGSNSGAHPGSINDASWHHLVHVFDRAADKWVTYLDGQVASYIKDAGTSLTDAGNIDTSFPATIGQDPTGLYGEAGSGDIDDLGVWKKALTPLEAASLYSAAVNNLSFTGAPITLTVQKLPGTNAPQLQFTWNAGMLQSATNVLGTYNDVTPVSPYTTSVTNAPRAFYRVKL